MIYKAYDSDTQKLLSLPETGMGYQVIEAKKPLGYREKFVVFNAQLIVDLDSRFLEFKTKIFSQGFSKILNEAEKFTAPTESIALVPKSLILEPRFLSETKVRNQKRHSGGRGATDNAKEPANGNEMFVRISAFENDKRIDFVNKKLLDGSFTTTFNDYADCVNTKDDPIDRYALPNNDEIKWAFYIKAKSGDQLQRGIVQPAFNHDGGGIECYFDKGTSINTLQDQREYGK